LHEGEKYGLHLSPKARRGLEEEIEITAHNMHELHRRGVRIVPGGDYGLVCTPMGRNARDLELFVTLFGFSPADSLIAATNHGGAMMGRGDELGQLRAGWLADLIVVDGDPLDDIALLQDRDRINLVMKDGQICRNDLPAAGAPR
jgi:imidazolonepropionase-like amidohydrolase